MEIEDRESTDSGSLSGWSTPFSGSGNYVDHGGRGVVPGEINMNISMDSSAAGMYSPPSEVGGGVITGGGVIGGGTVDGGGGRGVLGVVGTGGFGGGSDDLSMVKKKRGRPRKYDADGNLNPAYIKSRKVPPPAPQAGFTLSTSPSFEHSGGSKRGRGKHSGSSNWVLASLGEVFANTAGGDFTPHVITAYPGEDVAGKILTFAQKGDRGICVLSANGSVSNVTLRQPGSSAGLLTYEGRFEILTLTGSYTVFDNDGMRSHSGGLSVSLASPDGRVIGGGVAGSLMAATPIQIVVGSFLPNGNKRKYETESKMSPTAQCTPATVTAARPISQAPPEANIFPIQTPHFLVQNQRRGRDLPNSGIADWNGSGLGSDQRPSPDINISIPPEEN